MAGRAVAGEYTGKTRFAAKYLCRCLALLVFLRIFAMYILEITFMLSLMKRYLRKTASLLMLLSVFLLPLTSCEKADGDASGQEDVERKEGQAVVRLRLSRYDVTPFETKAADASTRPVDDVCTMVSVALFKDGERVKSLSLSKADGSTLSSVELAVDKGQYIVVAVAHNGTKAATVTSLDKITFSDNKVTDTFCCCDTVDISDDGDIDLLLRRCVAMFRLKIVDNVPSAVTSMKFYYTGGSSTLDAAAGAGCVNSRQTETLSVADAAHSASSVYEVYTFPHADGRSMRVTVSALDAKGNVLYERTYEDVPAVAAHITQYSDHFFEEDAAAKHQVSIQVDDTWTVDERDV